MQVIDIILKLIPLLGIFTLSKAILEYRANLNWKKAEFLAKEMEKFFNDQRIKLVLQMLDYNKSKVKLEIGETSINDVDLINALQPHNLKSHFTKTEIELRNLFDYFFDRLSTFNIYIQSGLINEVDLYLYIGYYVEIISSNNRKPEPLRNCFQKYIEYYRFIGASNLLKNMKVFKNP